MLISFTKYKWSNSNIKKTFYDFLIFVKKFDVRSLEMYDCVRR